VTFEDQRWLAATARLAMRARPMCAPNPGVAALIVKDGRVIARGWTQPGGRPHAEAIALAAAGEQARGATMFVTLEPCAHKSARGPACADLVSASGLARVVVGCADPDPRTAGFGMERIRAHGIIAELADSPHSRASLEGYLMQRRFGRPHVTLKLATSLDGCIALASGESQWITGPEARAHTHVMRARADAILVGGGTYRDDAPRLDVRLPGLEDRSPQRWVLTHGGVAEGWNALPAPQAITGMGHIQNLFIEGGAGAASAFLRANLVDRILLYRAPIVIGGGRLSIGDIGLTQLADAHNRWHLSSRRQLGQDTLDIYEANPCSPAS